MKTADLTGDQLHDYVAKALGYDNSQLVPDELCGWWTNGGYGHIADWEPSSNWEQGGRIIDQDDIDIFTVNGVPHARITVNGSSHNMTGATKLEAAMRCKVASVFGYHIEEEGEQA